MYIIIIYNIVVCLLIVNVVDVDILRPNSFVFSIIKDLKIKLLSLLCKKKMQD